LAWSFQKSGAALCVSISVSSRWRRATSKAPPKIGGAGRKSVERADVLVQGLLV